MQYFRFRHPQLHWDHLLPPPSPSPPTSSNPHPSPSNRDFHTFCKNNRFWNVWVHYIWIHFIWKIRDVLGYGFFCKEGGGVGLKPNLKVTSYYYVDFKQILLNSLIPIKKLSIPKLKEFLIWRKSRLEFTIFKNQLGKLTENCSIKVIHILSVSLEKSKFDFLTIRRTFIFILVIYIFKFHI